MAIDLKGFVKNVQFTSREKFLRICAIELYFSDDEEVQAFHESHEAVVLKLQIWGYDQLKKLLFSTQALQPIRD